MKVSSKVLAIDTWSHYIAIGSIVTQVIDLASQDGRRILIADSDSLKVRFDCMGMPIQHCKFSFSFKLKMKSLICRSHHSTLWPLLPVVTWSQPVLTAMW